MSRFAAHLAPIIVVSCLALMLGTRPADALERSRLVLPESAVASGGRDAQEARVEARLLLDLQSDEMRVGVLFTLDPGWHLYWRNPGEVGLATELAWQADGAAQVATTEWPAPDRFKDISTGLTSYGYEGEVLLSSVLTKSEGASQVVVDIDLLVCRSECIPESFQLRRPLVRPEAPEQVMYERSLFGHALALRPIPARQIGLELTSLYSRTSLRPGDDFEGAIALRCCESESQNCLGSLQAEMAMFFADLEVDDAVELDYLGLAPHPQQPQTSLFRFRGRVDPELEASLTRLSGVLELRGDSGGHYFVDVDLPFPFAAAGAPSRDLGASWLAASGAADAGSSHGLLRILLLALLGGLLINGMPCVLPVLGIKVCSAAELAQHDPSELRRHGFAYAAGILASMTVLALAVVALQAAGTQVGWGFQFQEPLFVAVVASVVVLFAMNLFGVYEIQFSTARIDQIGGSSQGCMRSFFDGLLCVVLATPCTAPFLGTAVGFAFANGALSIMGIFFCIGIGLASPYVAICLVPGWARYVPRPGNWMLRLRTGLGFLLMGTAVWLVWIFGRSAGVDGVATLLALLVVLAFGSWLLGWMQSLSLPRASLTMASLLVVFSVAGLNLIDVGRADRASESDQAAHASGWPAYDADQIGASLAQNQPVFVSFTADWCITCKVNERVVLRDSKVQGALSDLGFAAYRGDWTHRNEAIRAELARHGRAGVPLYLVYDPRTPGQPRVLPELLSVDTVLEALQQASQGLPGPDVALTQAAASLSAKR